jgi:hypothetical protein
LSTNPSELNSNNAQKRFFAMEKKIGKLETLYESMKEIKKLLTEKKSSVDASLFDSEPREPLDLHPVEFISDGTRMITAPVLLCEGDKAWWRYSANLVRSVEILECTSRPDFVSNLSIRLNVPMVKLMMFVTLSCSSPRIVLPLGIEPE